MPIDEKVLREGFNLDGLANQRSAVALQTGVEDKTYEDEWHSQRVREIARTNGVLDRVHRLRFLGPRPEIPAFFQDEHEAVSRAAEVP